MDENKPLEKRGNDEKLLDELTERNWLFIKNFLHTGDIPKSYKLSGYRSKERSAPYVLFNQLKHKIEGLGNLNITSKARLMAETNKLLELPLDDNKQSLTFSERLRLLKFIASITPDALQQKPQISMLVINKAGQTPIEKLRTIDAVIEEVEGKP